MHHDVDRHDRLEPGLIDDLFVPADASLPAEATSWVDLGKDSEPTASRVVAARIRDSIDQETPLAFRGGARLLREASGATGVFNVLAAVRHALNGADVDELRDNLDSTDRDEIVDTMTRMSAADVGIVRAFVLAYASPDPGRLETLVDESGLRAN